MGNRNRYSFILFLIIFISLPFLGPGASQAQHTAPPSVSSTIDWRDIARQLDMESVKDHVRYLSEFETRATGYLGNLEAAEYIQRKFVEYGLVNVSYDEFDVVETVDHGANITLLTEPPIRVYPMLPNLVCPSTTPPEGVEGPLIYASFGRLPDYEGLRVDGSIVLLNWESSTNWINAAKLGAKAVVFIPPQFPESPVLSDAGDNGLYTKFLPRTPLNFPRFYVNQTGANILLAHLEEKALLKSTHTWEKAVTRNVVGFILGTDPVPRLLLTSYYDSGSDCPSSAPGAQEACGISALLEIVRYLAQPQNKPRYTIMIVALGGHHQTIAGSYYLMDEYLWPAPNATKRLIGSGLEVWFNLDLTTGSDATYFTVTRYATRMGPGDIISGWEHGYITAKYFEGINGEVGRGPDKFMKFVYYDWDIKDEPTFNMRALPTRTFFYDSDIKTYLGCAKPDAYTFTTLYDTRPNFHTPFDTFDKIGNAGFSNLKTQIEFILTCIVRFVNMDLFAPTGLVLKYPPEPPTGFVPKGRETLYQQLEGSGKAAPYWGTIQGQTSEWSEEKAWYVPVPNCLVFSDFTQGYHLRFTLSDENGNFSMTGVFHWAKGSDYPEFIGNTIRISAWKVNATDGNVLYAPDLGRYMWAPYIFNGRPSIEPRANIGYLVVFKASTIAMFDASSPRSTSFSWSRVTYTPGWTGGKVMYPYTPQDVIVLNSKDLTPPLHFGTWINPYLDVVIITVRPGEPVHITLTAHGERYPVIYLANATEEVPLGSGYILRPSQQLKILNSPLQYFRNLHWLNKERWSKYLLWDPVGTEIQKQEGIIEEAESAIESGHNALALMLSTQAWSKELEIYMKLRPQMEDAASTVLFFAALLIPFMFLLERLLFSSSGNKRLIFILLIFAATLITFYFFHPGFQLASSPIMIAIGFSIIFLVMPVMFIVFSLVFDLIRMLSWKYLGKHEVGIGRLSTMVFSFSVGVENMRRRRIRTALILVAVGVVVTGLVGFASISTLKTVQAITYERKVSYDGILVRRFQWGHPETPMFGQIPMFYMSDSVVDLIKTLCPEGAIVAPRAWKHTLYPGTVFPKMYNVTFRVEYGNRSAGVVWLLGMTPQELNVTNVDVALTSGRWFVPCDTRVIILNEKTVEELGTSPEEIVGKEVSVDGIPLTVIGITGDILQYLKDIDGEALTPLTLDIPPYDKNPWYIHVDAEYVAIIPYQELVYRWGGYTASISVKLQNASDVFPTALKIFDILPQFDIFASVKKKNNVYEFWGERGASTMFGLNMQLVPVLIAVLSILNVMLGSVYERKREILTYSVVGLSPSQIAFTFVSEAVVYGVVGSVLGYLAGVLGIRAFSPIEFNYASVWVVVAMSAALMMTLLSSMYPMYLCTRLVTPSLERAWKIHSAPKGDVWEVSLPFIFTTERETKGVLAFLHEFLRAHMGFEAPVFNVRSLETLKPPEIGLTMETGLPPYELGVSQQVGILFPLYKDKWIARVIMKKTTGSSTDWVKLNRRFLDSIRKQFLLWTAMSEGERARYQAT